MIISTLLLPLLLFVCSLHCQEPAVVIPSFSCWFHTYTPENTRVVNLLYSYNNTGSVDQQIGTDSINNQITPLSFDGQQPILFKSGNQNYVFILQDSANLLGAGSSIVWTLNGQSSVVNQATIADGERCDLKFQGECPMWIDHFCEDSAFCNGKEYCSPLSILSALTTQSLGTCVRPVSGVVCLPGTLCNETTFTCLDYSPPPPPPSSIIPSFHCWSSHLDQTTGTMVTHLSLNYNNTASGVIFRPVTQEDSVVDIMMRNTILPSGYNGGQPTLFYSNFNGDTFVLRDSLSILSTQDGVIQWKLSDQELSLSRDLLSPENQCPTNPPPPPQQQTDSPTNTPTEEELTQEPDPVRIQQCSQENPDCTAYDTFCSGPTQCDTENQICLPIYSTYSPCQSVASSVTTNAPLEVSCVEHLSICIASVNCTTDQDCNDGIFCNGKESCLNGTCFAQENVTILELCGTENAICDESKHCVATNQTISDQAIAGIVCGIYLGVFVVVGFMGLYFWMRKKKVKKSKSKAKNR